MADPGIVIILQTLSSPFLDAFFTAVTHLGNEYAYILILMFVYWCIDRHVGHRAVALFLASMWLNGALKEFFATPRPSPLLGVRVVTPESGFGFPSGHAQGAVTLWGYLALAFRSIPFRLVALLAVLSVGFSRLYLGVHFLGDVVGGYAIGIAALGAYLLVRGSGFGSGLPRGVKVLSAVIVPLALVPAYQSDASFQILGFFIGWVASDLFALEALPYDPRAGFLGQFAKMGIGLAGMAVLYVLHSFLPEGLLESAGYAVITVWVTVLAPWLFIRLGLARPIEPTAGSGSTRPGPARSGTAIGMLEPFNLGLGRRTLFSRGTLDPSLKGVLWVAVAFAGVLGLLTWVVPSEKETAVLQQTSVGRPSIIGHRGAAGLAPENTVAGFRHGLASGADSLELDVRLTADGRLAVVHDETVDRTTDGNGRVRDMSLAAVQALDAGYRFSPEDGQTYPHRGQGITIPSLEAVLRAFPATPFVIEIKDDDPKVVDTLISILERVGAAERVIVVSFHDDVLALLRSHMPAVRTSAARGEALRFVMFSKFGLEALLEVDWEILAVPPQWAWLPIITQGLVEAAHRRGAVVFAWTIDDVERAKDLGELGVDGIITNVPDRMTDLAVP